MIRKKILTSVMALAVVATTYSSALAYVPIGKDYHIASDKIETDYFFKNESGRLQRSEYLEKIFKLHLLNIILKKYGKVIQNTLMA